MKKIAPFAAAYFTAVLLGVGLLWFVSLIPQSILTEHWQEDREEDFRFGPFRLVVMGDYGTYLDDYTDNMKIEIAYRLNEQSVFTPTAYIGYIDEEYDYGRYWHGYCIVIRPLLVFFNLSQIKILAGGVNLVLFVLLIIQLIRKGGASIAAALLLAAYITNFYIQLLSLQYFNCTFFSLLFSLAFVTRQELYEKYKYLIFFVIGLLVCYFDFLTFESVTLSLPLLLSEALSGGKDRMSVRIRRIAGVSVLWLLGYASMFVTKWLLYIAAGGAKELILYKVVQRTTGSNTTQQFTVTDSLALNFGMLKHLSFENWYIVLICCSVLWLLYVYLARGIHKEWKGNIFLLLIGLIPVMRLILVREHSASHAGFAYHALLTAVAVVVYPFVQLLGELFVVIKKRFSLGRGYK